MRTTSTAGLSFSYVYAPEVISLGAILPVVGIAIVGVRIYLRRVQKAAISIDDWLVLAALFMIIGMGVCLLAGAKLGVMGYPTPAPSPSSFSQQSNYVEPSLKRFQQIQFSFQILMLLAYALIKLSIIYFLRRLFIVTNRGSFNTVTAIAVALVLLWLLAFLGLFIFNCGSHVDSHWGSFSTMSTMCKFPFSAEQAMAISDLILDILIFLLPFPAIWTLHMTTTRKVAISGIFFIGAAAIAASITRLVIYFQIITEQNHVAVDENCMTVALYWSLIEAGFALVAACLPSISSLFRGISFNAIIRSFRSALSLDFLPFGTLRHSQRNTGTPSSQKKTYLEIEDHQSPVSQRSVSTDIQSGISAFVMRDLEANHPKDLAINEIRVHNTISQETSS